MKMISRRHSSAARSLFAILGASVVALILLRTPLAVVGSALAPLDRSLRAIEYLAPELRAWLRDHGSGVGEVAQERDEARAGEARARLELENLRAAMADTAEFEALKKSRGRESIVAGVLATPNETPYDTLILDMGSDEGVVAGAVVYAEGGRPIGTITRTTASTAIATLFTSPGITTHVYAVRERVLARAVGMGGGSLSVFLPHGSEPREGDSMLMPTLGGVPIGTVARVWSEPSEPGVIAAVTSPISLASLRMVSIDTHAFTMPSTDDIRAHIAEFTSLQASSTNMLFTIPDGTLFDTPTTSSDRVNSTSSQRL